MRKTDELFEAIQLLHDILDQLDDLELAVAAIKVSEAIEILSQSGQPYNL